MQLGNAQTRPTTWWIAVLSLVVYGSLVGCAQKAPYSGFLGDYSLLTPHPDVKGAMAYENPTKSLKQYDKFIVQPVVVHFAASAKGTAIDPGKLKELADYFHGEVVKALSERYRVVSAPGPGVLRIRFAITDIKKTIPAMNIHPGTKLTGVGLGGASVEAEALDSQTGERVAAVVDSQKGTRLSLTAGLTRYGHAKQVMRKWAERFVKRLDKVHGYR